MSLFDDFGARMERHDQERKEWRAYAKDAFIPGVDPCELRIGQRFTISPNLLVFDRSYTDEVWEVIARNSSAVQGQLADPEQRKGYREKPIIFQTHEHHFYDASDFQIGGKINAE